MAQNNSRITELTYKYASGEITPEEEIELWAYLNGAPERLARFEKRIAPGTVKGRVQNVKEWEAAKDKSREKTLRINSLEKIASLQMWRRTLVAASVVMIVGGIGIYKMSRDKPERQAMVGTASTDILPGGDKATLRLADGSVISLGSVGKGAIAQQGKTKVLKTTNGSISYDADGAAAGDAAMSNTIVTPRGGQYQVVLPDGSRAWLNAASSLTFPTAFAGDKREVQVTGEAYFEVAKDSRRPFLVKAGNISVTVLGTGFNVSDYPDESIKTTLIEGAVRVSGEKHSVLLRPGQQVNIRGEDLQMVPHVDTESVVAWRDGDFRFRGAPIDEVMRQLSRWYDIQVVYTGEKPQQSLTAVVSRNLPASEVLKALAVSGYHFKVDKDRIEIMP